MHSAPGPDGPWSFVNGSRNISLPGVFAGTNPSPAVLPNGSMVVGVHDDVGFVVFMAPTWRGPYTRVPGHLFEFQKGKYTFEVRRVAIS